MRLLLGERPPVDKGVLLAEGIDKRLGAVAGVLLVTNPGVVCFKTNFDSCEDLVAS